MSISRETDSNHQSDVHLHHQQRQRLPYHQLIAPEPESQGDSHKVNHRALGYGKRQKHNFFYPTANTKHPRFVARTFKLALPEGVESFPNIKSHTLDTLCYKLDTFCYFRIKTFAEQSAEFSPPCSCSLLVLWLLGTWFK